jgi:NADP-dependent alcohol dehydrogenase
MWTATNALNGLICCGVPQDWATHMIGHEVTAAYGIDHAQTLATVLPSVLRHHKGAKLDKLVQMGKRVFGIEGDDKDEVAEKTICAIEKFFHSIGMPTKLSDYNVDAKDAAVKIYEKLKPLNQAFGEHEDILPEVVKDILSSIGTSG